MLYAVSECLNGHFRGENIIFSILIFPDEIVNVPSKTTTDLAVSLLVLSVFIEREDIVDIVDEGCSAESAQRGRWRGSEVLCMFLYEEVAVVEQEPIEL